MKAIIVLSGGLDSTVLLTSMLRNGHEVKALSVDYGQRHRRELLYAVKVCAQLRIEHRVADLSSLRQFMDQSSQTGTIAVPHGHYAEESMKQTVVPNRNMILLAVAGAWAINLKFDAIAYAAHAGDHAIYPDCREEFVQPLAQALKNADWHSVEIVRPFLSKTKSDIVRIGKEVGAPMELTYSCYEGHEVHCGKCGTCVERREAFLKAGVKDPTRYA